MTTIGAFPSIPNAVRGGQAVPTFTVKAYSAIKCGQVVCFRASYTDVIPVPASGVMGTGMKPIGVAMMDIAASSYGTIALAGICYVACDSDSTAITCGKQLACGAYPGAVLTGTTGNTVVGIALETIAVSSYGQADITGIGKSVIAL